MAGIRTFARRVDGGYVVNGSKTYITNGVRADFVVTAVKTTEEGGHQGLSFLIIEREMEGFEPSKKLEKLGWHASDTGELAFSDVFVPDENLLGEENKGFYLIMANFQWERLLMALGAVAAMERGPRAGARGRAGGRAGGTGRRDGREARGGALPDLPRAAPVRDDGHARSGRSPRPSCCRSASAFEVAETAFRILDGDLEIGRAMRDTRLGPIGGGTDEVMKEILAKQLGL